MSEMTNFCICNLGALELGIYDRSMICGYVLPPAAELLERPWNGERVSNP